jgi:hypothetical protein
VVMGLTNVEKSADTMSDSLKVSFNISIMHPVTVYGCN